MTHIESAWDRHPDYRIDLVASRGTARVWHGDLLLAESADCIRLEETRHVDRIYFPERAVRWELFEQTEHHTICPFKGEADYWTLRATDPVLENPVLENVVWAYRDPFHEVAGIKGHVAFYQERLRIEVEERWERDGGRAVTRSRFPLWGDASDLLSLIDVEAAGPGRFTGPPHRLLSRNVVEGGQLLGQAIVAASKTVPAQRVTTASMIFSKAASFDAPLDVHVDVLKPGRTFSTVEVRIAQHEQLRSVGLLLMDVGAPDLIRSNAQMPDVAGPYDAEPFDFRMTGRDLRIVDAAYSPDPDRVGPPVIHSWVRFRDSPAHAYLHTALMVQSSTHWTIAAAMRPHAGFGEADAHVTLSTGIMSIAIALYDEVDVTEWLLYANPAIYAGRGLAQGEGKVFTQDGRLMASYSVQAMIRGFAKAPGEMGLDATNAM